MIKIDFEVNIKRYICCFSLCFSSSWTWW